MSTPILATKLYIPPPRPNVVARPRLFERLDEGLQRNLTLISAPAGFGKTTLLASWLASRTAGRALRTESEASELSPQSSALSTRVAWLSLDEADNDPTRFLAYLIAALQTIAPTLGAGLLALLHSAQSPPTQALLTALLNQIASLPDEFVLLLDDYHVIDAKPVEQALLFVLEHLPARMHLLIASREDPALPLARLRARGQLTEVRAADLRFSAQEAAGFLTQVMSLKLSAEQVAALEERTEGWIAGLQLAAISLQGRADASSFIRSFSGSHHFVLDYLVEEVLQHQSESVQSFLLRTSILDRLCGPLCDAVLGTMNVERRAMNKPAQSEDSSFIAHRSSFEMLEYLQRANLLLAPLDDRREWYRYHQLFAEVLQARLIKEQPHQLRAFHRRASEWYEQNNFLSDAIRHALAAEDFVRAAALIEPARSIMRGSYFQSATWLGWVKALPDEFVRARPLLSLGFAWELLFSGELEAAEARMRDADRLLEQPADIGAPLEVRSTSALGVYEEQQSLRASLAIAWAFHAQARGDVAGTEKHARRALTLVPETDYHTRGLAGSLLGLACLAQGDLETAHTYVADGMASLRMAGNLVFATSGTSVLADIRLAQGRLADAIITYEQALRLATAQGTPVLQGTAELHLGLSDLYIERYDLEAARRHLRRSEELGVQAALPNWPHRLCLAQAGMKQAEGNLAGALELLDEAERLYYRDPVPDVRPIAAVKARVWIRQGRLAEARGWARGRNLSADDQLSYLREFEHVTLASLLIARHKSNPAERSVHKAVELLERLRTAAEEGGRMGSVIEILVLQALAHEVQGEIPLALVPLERALSLAAPEGYVRVFVDKGIPMAGLLRKIHDEGRTLRVKQYTHKLLHTFPRAEDRGPRAELTASLHSVRSPQSSSIVEPLSQRELEILQLVAQGLSNQEISERLFLALNTVKGHNRNIFGKLQVQRRTEAVARARELGLL